MLSRPKTITIEKGPKGFGFSLIYRGLDKFQEKDTGIFVSRVVPDGEADNFGAQENDKILTINSKTPSNVEDAVGIIKQAGNQITLVVLRENDDDIDIPDMIINEGTSLSSSCGDSDWGMKRSVTPTVTATQAPEISKYKSTRSLHDLGLDSYPNPEMPEVSKLSRKEEKQCLQNLNNRLAGFIDHVRNLEQKNFSLTKKMKSLSEHQASEITHVKDMYNQQIDNLKASLESTNKQYNQLKLSTNQNLQENEDIKNKLKKKDNSLSAANIRIQDLEDQIRDLANTMNRLESEKLQFKNQLEECLPEVHNLREKLAEAKRNLHEEQLKSADLENKCARLEEDLKFKMQTLEKELQEVKNRRELEITKMDSQRKEEYEDRLQKALEKLREVYDTKMQQNRKDVEKTYEKSVGDLQAQLSKSRNSGVSTMQELKESKSRIVALSGKVNDLEAANLGLNQKISNLAQELEDLKSIQRSQLAGKDDEIKQLMDKLANQLKAYQNLQDIKIALDMEIAVYRRLIEVEEDRLGINDDEESDDMNHSSRASTPSRLQPAHMSIKRISESAVQSKVTMSQTML